MNIAIDSSLIRQAMQVTGLSTRKAVVEEGLRLLIKLRGQEGVRRLKGKIPLAENVRELDI
ncbi:MAG: type II toxin-antitoxin system VapB family antitoxin [Nitrospira sp.]|nr:type II toxin-antitoxin system VapB family antitoxin [Nitrospira sp.]